MQLFCVEPHIIFILYTRPIYPLSLIFVFEQKYKIIDNKDDINDVLNNDINEKR